MNNDFFEIPKVFLTPTSFALCSAEEIDKLIKFTQEIIRSKTARDNNILISL